MGLFFDSAEDKAKKASLNAHAAEEAFKQSAHLLGILEARFHQISQKLPKEASAHMMAPYARSLRQVRTHAERTLIHIRHLEEHVAKAEEHISKHGGK